ncbi:hypothetical protein J31TS4_44520 [Paenibacillus sp. J31TS4]|nr:hypothetical protein J31TS4_44520 [Paenibacillus sp. J31TS4]
MASSPASASWNVQRTCLAPSSAETAAYYQPRAQRQGLGWRGRKDAGQPLGAAGSMARRDKTAAGPSAKMKQRRQNQRVEGSL